MKKLMPGQAGPISIRRNGSRWVARVQYRTAADEKKDIRSQADTQSGARQGVLDTIRRLNMLDSGSGLTPESTVRQCAASYLARLDREELSEETARVYRSTLTKWVVEGDAPVCDMQLQAITPLPLSDLLFETGVRGGVGAAKMLRTVLRHAMTHAVRAGVLIHNPAREATFSKRAVLREQAELGVEKISRVDHRRAFTPAEERRLFDMLADDADAQAKRLPDLLTVLGRTGMRIGEGCRTTRDHLSVETRRLDVPGTKTEAALRRIMVPQDFAEQYADATGHLAPAPLGGERDVSNSIRDVRAFLDRSGFEWASSHTFRRTVATKLDLAGFSAREIADHLGHVRPSMTQDVYMGRGQPRDMSNAL